MESLYSQELYIILSTPPAGFPTRKSGIVGMCAMLSLKALIEGYDKTHTKEAKAYAHDIFSKISGFMLPFSVTRVLRKYNTPHKKITAKRLTPPQKIALLKENLQEGPIFLLIANARGGTHVPKMGRAITRRHYITLRGYDERKQIFFVYDSNTKERISHDVPMGNSRLSYKDTVKYRSIGASRIVRNYAISVKYPHFPDWKKLNTYYT
ncbi:MAG: hypothetical protein PHU61_01385 [Candidatus Absconditabacteria bacterium]|nr:hypothetical protein [Candidatus Absconditabacteria bacterium]MDD3868047.1 hypothetical protein [Candidatus Absconditabacteria bacterium]MDD4714294.1 hypothetical protein [Candidatus Absconditabacteria bacterium]